MEHEYIKSILIYLNDKYEMDFENYVLSNNSDNLTISDPSLMIMAKSYLSCFHEIYIYACHHHLNYENLESELAERIKIHLERMLDIFECLKRILISNSVNNELFELSSLAQNFFLDLKLYKENFDFFSFSEKLKSLDLDFDNEFFKEPKFDVTYNQFKGFTFSKEQVKIYKNSNPYDPSVVSLSRIYKSEIKKSFRVKFVIESFILFILVIVLLYLVCNLDFVL